MLKDPKKSGAMDARDALKALSNDYSVPQNASAPNRSRSVRRINLELLEKANAQLEWLEEETGASSSAEVIRDALKLYYGLVHEVINGGTITIIESSGEVKSLKVFL